MPLELARPTRPSEPSRGTRPALRGGVRTLAFSIVVLGAAVMPSLADAQLQRTGSPDVSFSAAGPAGFSIVGKSNTLAVVDTAQTLSVTVPLAPLTTGISLRDKHMKEKYLEVQKYPDAELQVPRSAISFPESGKESSADVDGTLKLHGQTHPVRFHYRAKRDGSAYSVQATMHVNMNEYGIAVPSYLGVTVKPDIEISVKFDAVDK